MTEKRDNSRWKLISDTDVNSFNGLLMKTHGSIFQYPVWNESFRRMYFNPQYLVYSQGGEDLGYVCILSIGPKWLRIGIIHRGPVALENDVSLPDRAIADLCLWVRQNGYIFLRLTTENDNVLRQFASAGRTEEVNAFPFYRQDPEDLIVEQVDSDAEMLLRFQTVARRNIKKAVEAGYEIRQSDRADLFAEVWPLFEKLVIKKGLQQRPLSSYLDLIEKARPWGGVGIYAAYMKGVPVQAIFLLRDGTTAHYISGALDVDIMGEEASPACLIHWTAMRDFFKKGAKYYNLGTRSGPVYTFKKKFRPTERINPVATTFIINKPLFSLWKMTVLRIKSGAWAKLTQTIFR